MKKVTTWPRIGIRFPHWATFTKGIFTGVLQYMRLHQQWQIQTPMDTTNEMKPVVIDENWEGDGLILFRLSDTEARAFQERKIPVVNVSSESDYSMIPNVLPDNNMAGRLAAEHLITLGLSHFAFWGDPTRRYSCERRDGFRSHLLSHGLSFREIPIKPHAFPWDHRWEHMYEAIVSVLTQLPTPIGIFTKDDMLAANILFVCGQLGISVPDDVAVIGMNSDDIFCQTTAPPLSSVMYPGEAIGYHSAEILDNLMAGSTLPLPYTHRVPIQGVQIRESSNILICQDPAIQKAIQTIRTQAPEYPLRVEELLSGLPISSATFKRKFTHVLGISPKAEITRVRLEHLRSLLLKTDWPIHMVAQKMRFESPEELCRFFRRETGTAPTDFRLKYRAPDVGKLLQHSA